MKHTAAARTRRALGPLALALAASVAVVACTPGGTPPAPTGRSITRMNGIGGAQPDAASWIPVVSPNGRYVAFHSDATNMAPGAPGDGTLYLHDRQTGARTAFVPTDGWGAGTNRLLPAHVTSDGRFVLAEDVNAPSTSERFRIWNVLDGTTVALFTVGVDGNPVNGSIAINSLSPDGLTIVLSSGASNLVADDTNTSVDVFTYDVATATATRVDPLGVAPDASTTYGHLTPDGRYLSFVSRATNLPGGFTNGVGSVYVLDLVTNTLHRQPTGLGGADPDGDSLGWVTDDGASVVVQSDATNLVAGDGNASSDVLVWDLAAGTYTRAMAPGGIEPNGGVFGGAIANASKVLIAANASNLRANDTNGSLDYYVWTPATGAYERITGKDGIEPNGFLLVTSASADLSVLAELSAASNLVPNDTNNAVDAFVQTR